MTGVALSITVISTLHKPAYKRGCEKMIYIFSQPLLLLFLFHLYIAFIPLEGLCHIHLEFWLPAFRRDFHLFDIGEFGEGVHGHGNEEGFTGGAFDVIQFFAEVYIGGAFFHGNIF